MALLTFRKVRNESGDDDAIRLTLHRDVETGRVCGWFLGPVRYTSTGVSLPYLAKSARTLASVAVVRALAASHATGCPLCVVDPDDLWEPAWAGC